jgi:hypothetical protein
MYYRESRRRRGGGRGRILRLRGRFNRAVLVGAVVVIAVVFWLLR